MACRPAWGGPGAEQVLTMVWLRQEQEETT